MKAVALAVFTLTLEGIYVYNISKETFSIKGFMIIWPYILG